MFWIKKNADYLEVFSYKRKHETENIHFHYKPCDKFVVGIVVSKKVGNSVVRHKVKRQIKAILQTHSLNTKNFALVIRPKRKTEYNQLLNEIQQGIRRIERRI